MNIAAFDLGTHTGYAHYDGVIRSGAWAFTPKTHDGEGYRFLKALVQFSNFLKDNQIEAVFFEDIKQRALSVQAGHVYGGLKAALLIACEQQNLAYRGITPGEWKCALGIKGNANKNAVGARLTELGYGFTSEDEADAIGILLSGIKIMENTE